MAEERAKLIAEGKTVPEPASLYTLRHSFATALVEGAAPSHVIARAMGHTDTRMVEAHYAHPSDAWQNEQVRAALPTFGVKFDKNNVVPIEVPEGKSVRRASRRKA